MANLSKTLNTNFYQNPSTFAEVMHKSILVCFYAPQCSYILTLPGIPLICKCLLNVVVSYVRESICSTVFTGAVTYRVVQVTPNEDGQPQLVAGLPSNQASISALL